MNNSTLSDDKMKLALLRAKLKLGEYDGADIMLAWLALDELIAYKTKAALETWVKCSDRFPDDQQFVLAESPSGYANQPTIIVTAQRDKAFRGDSWLTVSGDRLTDFGLKPTQWKIHP